MIRRRDRHRIDVLAHLIEQLAVILEALGLCALLNSLVFRFRELVNFLVEGALIHVADGNDVPAALRGSAAVAVALTADADAGDVDPVVRAQDATDVREGESRRAGSQFWAGLANSYFWVDPTAKLAGVTASAYFPFADAAAIEAFEALEQDSYRAFARG